MYRIIIRNESKNLEWYQDYPTQEEAIIWREKQKGKSHRLPGEATFSDPIDLSLDKQYMLEKLQNERRRKYPDIYSQLEAITEKEMGRPEKMNDLILKIQEVKSEIPIAENLRGKL